MGRKTSLVAREGLPHLVVWPQPQLPVAHGAADVVRLLQVLEVALQGIAKVTNQKRDYTDKSKEG